MALGKSSRVISLPKNWLEDNGLDKGDTILIRPRSNGSLVIHPGIFTEEVRKISLQIKSDESENSIIRRIIGSFLDGHSHITLTSDKIFTSTQQEAIRSICHRLYMMVINSESSRIELETIIDESKASVVSCIERMHMITYAMFRDTIASLKTWDQNLAMSIASLEEDVDQLLYLVLRIIRTASINPTLANQLSLDPLDCLDFHTIVNIIERVADHVTDMALGLVSLMSQGLSLPDDVNAILSEAAEITFHSYDEAVQCFMYGNIEPTNGIINKQNEIKQLYTKLVPMTNLFEGFNTDNVVQVVKLRESIIRISSLSADIAELTIDRVCIPGSNPVKKDI